MTLQPAKCPNVMKFYRGVYLAPCKCPNILQMSRVGHNVTCNVCTAKNLANMHSPFQFPKFCITQAEQTGPLLPISSSFMLYP